MIELKKYLAFLTIIIGFCNPVLAHSFLAQSLMSFDEVIEKAKKEKNDTLLANALYNKVAIFYNQAMDDSVIYYVPQYLIEIRKIKQWNKYYEMWTHLANTYLYSGQPNKALREVQAIFDDAKKQNNTFGMGIAYYTMGSVYTSLNDLDESVSSYQRSIDLLSKIKPCPMVLPDIYAYYGDVLNLKKEYVRLEQLTFRWKELLDEYVKEYHPNKSTIDVLYTYYYMACAQADLGLGKLKKGEDDLRQARMFFSSESSLRGQSWLFYMAQLRYLQKRYPEALQFNDRRMKYAGDGDDITVYIDIISQRADILKALGNYKDAADYYLRMYQINDSVNAQETKKQLNEMNTLFKVDELKMEQERAQFRNTMIIVGLIILALVIFSIFRYIAAKRLKVAHEKLQTTHEELLTAYDQLEETTTAKERIESDLRIARDIQQSMIPQKFPPFPERSDIDLFASMTPAKAVGGDLYDFILLNEKLYFCLGDVSGKGVPASLFMAVARNLFRVVSQQGLPPAEIADKLNNALSEDNDSGMFVTMFIGVVDLQTGHLEFCNAGHNPPVIKMPDGSTHFIEMQPNAPLGLWAGLPYEGEAIDDISGCPFFVYSDGLNEAENDKQEQYGDDLLLEMLEKHEFVSSQQTVEMMKADVVRHANGAEQSDDLTMLCVKVKGNLPKL
ncbi:MAG: SpoIIE family protein phosphatase [Prevotella sp.]|nr:SpoIIE family protein phosphatase [Prevotella sp.]